MRNKKIVLTISIIVFLVIAGVLSAFCVGRRPQMVKQVESNKAGKKANKKIEKKEQQVEKVTLTNIVSSD